MIAVIFEFRLIGAGKQEYFDLAAKLRAELDTAEGFLSIERFESLSEPGKFVSLSFWRDEDAVKRWRNLAEHRAAQKRGRGGVFADYRLRVASVSRDYGMDQRGEAPTDSRAEHG